MRPFLISCLTGWLACVSLNVVAAEPMFAFKDVLADVGLAAQLETPTGKRPWRYAHGAAWGDVDGDDRPDLFLGAFAGRPYFRGDDAPIPNGLFLNGRQQFSAVENKELQALAGESRCAGALFADLDSDGDLDLVVTNHVQKVGQGTSRLFENQGGGKFRDATPDLPPFTAPLGLRNVGAIDANRDGLLDLILVDGTYGKTAVAEAKLWLLLNRGGLRFEDATAKYGLPTEKASGLGLAMGDVNNDRWPDLFVAGCNRLFVSDKQGHFREGASEVFAITPLDKSEGSHCGAAFGDFNADGWLDLVTTEHGVPTKVHVFENRGVGTDADGLPKFVEVTQDCGLPAAFPPGTRQRPIKTAHVAAADMNCDGRVDIMTTLLMQDGSAPPQPVVIANVGALRGKIAFGAVPTEKLTGYFAPGPLADFDRDGRLDIFLPSWFENLPNYLFRNETAGPRGLTVRVKSRLPGFNPQGIGATVRAFTAGHAHEAEHLLARTDITIGNGYASGEEALAHLGLGTEATCDLVVTWQEHVLLHSGAKAGEFVTLEFGAPMPAKKVGAIPNHVVGTLRVPSASCEDSDGTRSVPATGAEKAKKKTTPVVAAAADRSTIFPPTLGDNRDYVVVTGNELLTRPANFPADVPIAKTAPRVEFLLYPGQTYAGKPWSNWGDASFAKGQFYSAIGDHLAPRGRAFVYAYEPQTRRFTCVTDVHDVLQLPDGHYTPGKIHTHVELGRDGWLYFATHRGSTRATTAANHFRGEWILRGNPQTGESQVVAHAPVPGHCIPNGMLDPERLIYYGGTAPGEGPANAGIQFFAYDITQKKVLYAGENGPARAMMLASSTGRVYFTPGNSDRPLMRYDATTGKPPQEIPGEIGVRAATHETPQGKIYTTSQGNKESPTLLYAFDVKSEKVETLGPAAVGSNHYVASLKADPTGRYLYYVPGAHGGADADGSPIVQYDVQTKTRKVLAFLHPALDQACGYVPKGTYGIALDARGERLFITWNVSRGGKNWDCCGLTMIEIPAAEREGK